MSGTAELLGLMNQADREVPSLVGAAIPAVARAVEAVAARLSAGGRLIYAGAGTSGRLGALDAAEVPPTFGLDPSRVVALLAGGRGALLTAAEGAEDDVRAASRDLAELELSPRDAVLAIAASGTTPYAVAALHEATRVGALAVALSCTAGSPLETAADLAIVVETGPEVLKGSTRLKAASAEKLVLNMLSTAVMAKLGLVYRGEMVAMRPTNAKLRLRAVRIVAELLDRSPSEAEGLLAGSRWELPVALVAGRWNLTAEAAREHLEGRAGNVDRALSEPP